MAAKAKAAPRYDFTSPEVNPQPRHPFYDALEARGPGKPGAVYMARFWFSPKVRNPGRFGKIEMAHNGCVLVTVRGVKKAQAAVRAGGWFA